MAKIGQNRQGVAGPLFFHPPHLWEKNPSPPVAALIRSKTAVETGSSCAAVVLIIYIGMPADCASSATSSGGTMLELSGPFENTTITFLPGCWPASCTVNNSEL